MRRPEFWAALGLCAISLTSLAAQAPRPCDLPTPSRQWEAYSEKRLSESESRFTPAWPAVLGAEESASTLKGRYTLTVVQHGNSGDQVTTGLLELVVADALDIPHVPSRAVAPLLGWADIPERAFGHVQLAHPIGARLHTRPGVRLHTDTREGRVSLWLGNSIEFGPMGALGYTTHSGITAYVLSRTSEGFVGRWTGSSSAKKPPQGHFCAWRQLP